MNAHNKTNEELSEEAQSANTTAQPTDTTISRRSFLRRVGGALASTSVTGGLAYTAANYLGGSNKNEVRAADFESRENINVEDNTPEIMTGKPDDIDEDTWRDFHPATRNYYRNPNSEESKKLISGMPPTYSGHEEGREVWIRMTPEFRNASRVLTQDMISSGAVDTEGVPTNQTPESSTKNEFIRTAWKQPALQTTALMIEHASKPLISGYYNSKVAELPPELLAGNLETIQAMIAANKQLQARAQFVRTTSAMAVDGMAATGGGAVLALGQVCDAAYKLYLAAADLFEGRSKQAKGRATSSLGQIVGTGIGWAIWNQRRKKEDLQSIELPEMPNILNASKRLEAALESAEERAKKEISRREKRRDAEADAETAQISASSRTQVAQELQKEAAALREANQARREASAEEREAERLDQERMTALIKQEQSREALEQALITNKAETAAAQLALEEQQAKVLEMRRSNVATEEEIEAATAELARLKREHQAEQLQDQALEIVLEQRVESENANDGSDDGEVSDEEPSQV